MKIRGAYQVSFDARAALWDTAIKCFLQSRAMTSPDHLGHIDDCVFDDFSKISDRFPKIFEDFPKLFRRPDESRWILSKNFGRCPKTSVDCRKLSRRTRRCLDHTLAKLSTINEANLTSVKSSISSLVRIWIICHSSHGCSLSLNLYPLSITINSNTLIFFTGSVKWIIIFITACTVLLSRGIKLCFLSSYLNGVSKIFKSFI